MTRTRFRLAPALASLLILAAFGGGDGGRGLPSRRCGSNPARTPCWPG